MHNIELLAPAGSFEALVAAVQNGANAIYIGGTSFSARASATNFTNQQITEAVEYVHMRNVKLYVAVNVLYQDSQFEELHSYISFLYTSGVDAIIVQDIGLLHMVKHSFPDFEIHISTQASIKDIEGVEFYEKLGADRVVLARENSIDEIHTICHNTNLDVEVFVHGAICMAYSGQCLFSSFIAKRSGNQGTCGQPCRLPYKLLMNNISLSTDPLYLLSPKDLCTIEHVDKLIEAGIHSFKIEGRMKRPEYVATVVASYRKAIDDYLSKKNIQVNQEIYNMKTMFNRGFTKGHLFNDDNFTSKKFPGNKGMKIGQVIRYDSKNSLLFIQLQETLRQEDRVLFKDQDLVRTITKLYFNKKLVNKAQEGDIVAIELNIPIKPNTPVYRVYNHEFALSSRSTYQKENIKTPINMSFTLLDDGRVKLQVSTNKHQVEVISSTYVEKALNASLTKERIVSQLSKLGNTLYYCQNFDVTFEDGLQFPVKELNILRRNAIEMLDKIRIEYSTKIIKPIQNLSMTSVNTNKNIILKVRTIEQLKKAIEYNCQIIYFEANEQLSDAINIYHEHNLDLYIYTTYTTSKDTVLKLLNIKDITKVMVASYQAYMILNDKFQLCLDSNFNIYNSYATQISNHEDVVLSREISMTQLKKLVTNKNLYCYVYGYTPAMIIKHCIISNHYFDKKVIGCNKCKKGRYCLQDRKKSIFQIQTDSSCNNIILNDRPLFYKNYKSIPVNNYILDFQNEDANQMIPILDYYINEKPIRNLSNFIFTKGYFIE